MAVRLGCKLDDAELHGETVSKLLPLFSFYKIK